MVTSSKAESWLSLSFVAIMSSCMGRQKGSRPYVVSTVLNRSAAKHAARSHLG